MASNQVLKLYHDLLKRFGEPGPWPWYDQGPPQTAEEIIIGAILTQHTNWHNVSLALANLKAANKASLTALRRARLTMIARLIKPAGYYQQKARRLKAVADCLHGYKVSRDQLLQVKGIGPETADVIMLYAFRQPYFVIDTYTRRFVRHYRLTRLDNYERLQAYFQVRLPRWIKIYQNYHALIIRWGKQNKV